MRIRAATAMLAGLLVLQTGVADAQRTGDRARLVFTISGAYLDGVGLWAIPNQLVDLGLSQDVIAVERSVKSSFGAGLSGTYFAGERVGLTAEAFFMDLAYDDGCRLVQASGSVRVAEVCSDIDQAERGATGVALSFGAVFRLASREFISPFARVQGGFALTNQSSVVMRGQSPTFDNAILTIYEDDAQTRIRPTFSLGVGTTVVLSRGYHLRWEVRDQLMGIVAVAEPVDLVTRIPPRETVYKHRLSILIGLDVILERQRGRRY